MQITDFTAAHIEQAARIALQNYEAERGCVPALPPVDAVPDLTPFAEHSLGVAAFDNGGMVGFLCGVSPFENAFGSTGVTGVFSPMGANGAVGENRAEVYARMYQAAGEKWVRAGAVSHAICLYAHDTEAQQQFFRYGFGMRCIDAIREMDEIASSPCEGYTFSELASENALQIMPLDNLLHRHLLASPFSTYRVEHNESDFLAYWTKNKPDCFVANCDGQIAAFILVECEGETFISNTPGYRHITAAYCRPEHRGKGLNQSLIGLAVRKLKAQGCTRLGVDFESINPVAYGFWRRYFDAYTHSVVRRIDEHVLPYGERRHTVAGFEIRPATREDLSAINRVYDTAREYMERGGNPTQWSGGYPWAYLLDDDIEKRRLFVILANGEICGVFAFIIGVDPTYIEIENGAWLNDEPYGTIHRIASDGTQRGIFKACLEFCRGYIGNIRIDTHADNAKMRATLAGNGFAKCGTIFVHDGASGHSPRIAYQYSQK